MEAIERFTRVLAQCGGSPEEIAAALSSACRRIPKGYAAASHRAAREMNDASHVLTVWFSDPLYVDRDGSPIRLPVRGPAPSLEALLQRVDRSLNVDELLTYLVRTHAVKQLGTRYVPKSRALSLRGVVGLSLRGLVGMLRTLEHNLRPKDQVRSWFEYVAENPRFPARARAAFDARLDRLGMEFLHGLDADMHRRESALKPGERTVRIGVGMYRFEDEPEVRSSIPPRRATRKVDGRRRDKKPP